MSLTVTIYRPAYNDIVDVSERVMSLSISEKMDSISTISARLKNLERKHALDEVAVSYNARRLFTGVIEGQDDSLRGGADMIRFSTWNGKDNTMRLDSRVVNRSYSNMTAEAIIADLLYRYPTIITRNNVQATGQTIEAVNFHFMTLLDCIRTLAEITGYRWYVDADNDLHFFKDDEGVGATVFSTSNEGGLVRNILRDSIDVRSDADERTANRVWIVGAKTSSPNYTEQFWVGDGYNSVFTLAFVPNYPEVYEDGVPKTIELVNEMSTKDYVYDKKNRVLRRVAGPLPAGVQLKFRYRPTVQIIEYFDDHKSIAQFGLYEKAISDRTITEKMAARMRGRAELQRRSTITSVLTLQTREMDVVRGKRYRIVIPQLEIDSYWLCTGIVTEISAPENVNMVRTVQFERKDEIGVDV